MRSDKTNFEIPSPAAFPHELPLALASGRDLQETHGLQPKRHSGLKPDGKEETSLSIS